MPNLPDREGPHLQSYEEACLEIERLRDSLNEARGLAREYLHCLRAMNPYDVSSEGLDKDVKSHPWLLEPESATATGVAEAVFGMTHLDE